MLNIRNMIINDRDKVIELSLMLLYKLILDITYITIQSSLFEFYGFNYQFDIIRYVVGWLFFLFGLLLIKSKDNGIGGLFVVTIFMISITPFIVLYQFDQAYKSWMVIVQILCIGGMNVIINHTFSFSEWRMKGIDYKSKKLRNIIVLLLLVYLGYAIYRFGIPALSSLSFEEVSNTRANVHLSTFESILLNFICKIINPLVLVIAFKEKKYVGVALTLFIQIYTYAVTGFKTFLFIPIVIMALQYPKSLNLKKTVLIGLPLAVLLTDIVYLITKNNMIYAVINNRVFFLPAEIKFYYFDYFSQHEYIHFSQSTLAGIFGIQSNYSTNIPNLIGEYYFNKPKMWANTGFMADAYSNLGILGMILISVVLSAALVFLKNQLKHVASDLQKPLQALFLIFFISLNDGSAISIIFSGGLLFAILIMGIIKFDSNDEAYQDTLSK